jgi:xanthine dehydrogenase accessory factor
VARDRVLQQVAAQAREWILDGRRVAAALLVSVEGSAPLDIGATMYVDRDGGIEGSITGGCIEGAVVEQALELFATDGPARLLTYGISDEIAGSVGLMCGGTVHVLLHELRDGDRDAAVRGLDAILGEHAAGLVTLVDGPEAGRKMFVTAEETIGTLGISDLLDHNVAREARGFMAQGRSAVRSFGTDGSSLGDGLRVHFTTYAIPPQMVIVGANDFAAAIAQLSDWFGYRATLIDARPAFLASKRFASHATPVRGWPDDALAGMALTGRDAIVVCTHDPKFDTPALIAAFATEAGYIGALGSRRTASDRTQRLRDAGASQDDLERVHAPCGLDIGAATVDETAVAVLAEIIADRGGRKGGPLRETGGPIRATERARQATS